MTFPHVFRRDGESASDNDIFYEPSAFIFLALFLVTCSVTGALLYRRRCRRVALQGQLLPQHHQRAGRHQRTLTITTTPCSARGETIHVYDEKMNLIANSADASPRAVPEIHVTFPDEENSRGDAPTGRVVILRISDSGSVGMEPLHREPLPPYQHADAARFQSLDLDRMGGLKEKTETPVRYL